MLKFCHSIQHKYGSFTIYNLPGTIDVILLAPAFCYFIENGDIYFIDQGSGKSNDGGERYKSAYIQTLWVVIHHFKELIQMSGSQCWSSIAMIKYARLGKSNYVQH